MMAFARRSAYGLLATLALAFPIGAQGHITTPKEALGANLGDDYFLASYRQISDYWRTLARQSERMKLVEIGRTAEGRPHLMAIVTSPENHKRLAHYKDISARLAHAEGLGGVQTPVDPDDGFAFLCERASCGVAESLGHRETS